jgi:DNA-binding transcriptional MerR regulator
MALTTRANHDLTDADLGALREAHPEGLTAQQIVAALVGRGDHLTEATFRKYVQLGLLPKSTRVAKGKSRGSQGLYPPSAVRQVQHIRGLMAQGYTIEDIQRQCLFVRGDVEVLERQLERVLRAVERAAVEKQSDALVPRLVAEARALGAGLVEKLVAIEGRLAVQTRMSRAAV